MNYIYSDIYLQKESEEWKKQDVLGIDLECENNLHHYGVYLCLIQISSRDKDWIVDPLQIKDLTPVVEMLENPKIQKIFHDVDFDFRMLDYELKCHPKNIFDTQVATKLLGKKDLGLSSLLEEYFNVKKTKFQKADWTKRPLPKKMLDYAIRDTKYLVEVKNRLEKELKDKNRLSWAEEEFKHIEGKNWELHQFSFMDMKGITKMSDNERAILKNLYELRERLAKKVDRPFHFIIHNKKLIELAKNPPTLEQWKTMKGVHPIVKKKAELFYDTVEKGKKQKLKIPKEEYKRFTKKQREDYKKLEEVRAEISKKIKIEPSLILNKDQMREIVKGNLKPLMMWQTRLLDKYQNSL